MSDFAIHLTTDIIGEAVSPPRDEWQAALSLGGVCQIIFGLRQLCYVRLLEGVVGIHLFGGLLSSRCGIINNEPRGARLRARGIAPRPCIRLDTRRIQTMKQPFASAARLRGGRTHSHHGVEAMA